jgi:hypothetical protein
MRSPPTGFVIESLLVAFHAFPTKKVRGAIGVDELNHVTRYAIATLATFDCFVFRHLDFFPA